MSRIRTVYSNCQLFAGPALDTGVSGFHILRRLNRIQSFSNNIEINRFDLLQLGNKGTIERPIIDYPVISFDFNYFVNGVGNENKIGLDTNYSKYYSSFAGEVNYANNTGFSLLSGIDYTGRTLDKRNFYLITTTEGRDVNDTNTSLPTGEFVNFNESNFTDPNAANYGVLGFTNCYLNSYATEGAVGNLPTASAQFIADSMVYLSSGSGAAVPVISQKSGINLTTGTKFIVPRFFRETGVTVLRPGDITIDITSNGSSNLQHLNDNFTDVKITNYSIGFSLNRETLNSLGYRIPPDRQINYPVFADINIGYIPGDSQSGSCLDLIQNDVDYNFAIKIKNPANLCNPTNNQPLAIRYDIIGAKAISKGDSIGIGESKKSSLSFQVELNPDNLTKGLWISGLLNNDKIERYLLTNNLWRI